MIPATGTTGISSLGISRAIGVPLAALVGASLPRASLAVDAPVHGVWDLSVTLAHGVLVAERAGRCRPIDFLQERQLTTR
jgi:hypothetical protein